MSPNLRAYLTGRREVPSINDRLRRQRKNCVKYRKIFEKNGLSWDLLGSNNPVNFLPSPHLDGNSEADPNWTVFITH